MYASLSCPCKKDQIITAGPKLDGNLSFHETLTANEQRHVKTAWRTLWIKYLHTSLDIIKTSVSAAMTTSKIIKKKVIFTFPKANQNTTFCTI